MNCFRAKMGGNPTESQVIAALPQGIALEFERCEAARKLRLLLSELLFITYQVNIQSIQ
jgi:Integrator complex subunit 2